MKCYTKGYLQFWIYAQIIKSIDGNFMIPDIESHPKNNFFRKKNKAILSETTTIWPWKKVLKIRRQHSQKEKGDWYSGKY